MGSRLRHVTLNCPEKRYYNRPLRKGNDVKKLLNITTKQPPNSISATTQTAFTVFPKVSRLIIKGRAQSLINFGIYLRFQVLGNVSMDGSKSSKLRYP
jgi:hypothetical protein